MFKSAMAVLVGAILLPSAAIAQGTDGTVDGRDVCLKVEAIDSLSTDQVATAVMNDMADVLGPGEVCSSDSTAMPIQPRDDLLRVHRIAWSRLEVMPDGQTLVVLFQGGDDDCIGLERVDVSLDEAGLDVSVYAGDIPDAQFCDLALRTYVTVVELDEPLVLGGDSDAQ